MAIYIRACKRQTIKGSNLRSNFFYFLCFVNSTKHFKKNTSCLIGFSKLSSAKILSQKIRHQNSIYALKKKEKNKRSESEIIGFMLLPICLLSLIKCSNVVFIVLLIKALDFPRISLFNPRSKTGIIVLR